MGEANFMNGIIVNENRQFSKCIEAQREEIKALREDNAQLKYDLNKTHDQYMVEMARMCKEYKEKIADLKKALEKAKW